MYFFASVQMAVITGVGHCPREAAHVQGLEGAAALAITGICHLQI